MRSEDQVKVLVVDDHVGIRLGITSLINAERPRMGCVGAAATIHEALARTGELQPDVVVLDIDLDGEDGLALIPALHRAAPCAVVVLTSFTDASVQTMAIRQGARACLHKTAPAAELIAAIHATRRAVGRLDAVDPASRGSALSYPAGTN